ncbi:hypothetical protein M885DRAFT_618474 [Pelagophyceae sp. CCMP2097]|nr:hypothetical protein M885DRAFT_618474 [Pelagophyceae sp. CCMP2097]
MVFYFESSEGVGLFMGKDKFENEALIAHGWPEDVWFHVDDLSSAHVYARLPRGPLRLAFRESGKMDHLPETLKECCALVKANSIAGSKQAECDVVYTNWENLRKTSSMVEGQVGFKDEKAVVKMRGIGKDKDLVRQLEKSKREEFPDLAQQRRDRDSEVSATQKAKQREASKAQRLDAEKHRLQAHENSYDRIFEKAKANAPTRQATADASAAIEAEEDFM